MAQRRRSRSRLILVLGGAASGKKQVALEKAGPGGSRAFVATGQALDGEMTARIERPRPPCWPTGTAEVPRAGRVVSIGWLAIPHDRRGLSDLWLSNLCGRRMVGQGHDWPCGGTAAGDSRTSARVVVVSNELGFGLVPTNRTRARSATSRVASISSSAAAADEVYFVSGRANRFRPK